MSRKVEFFLHNLDENDISAACEVLRSVFLTTGSRVKEFESGFAKLLNIQEAVAVTSCTGALHLALMRYGIGPGDEVITTPMTFVATATAILEVGATPVFVDVCPNSGLLTPEAVEKHISEKTRAIVPVHLYGRMVDVKGFSALAQKHDLIFIEDAAHCIEGIRDEIRPGQLSHAACFSFYATKNITCGEGGALVTRSSEDAAWYRSARHHGISKNAASRYSKKYEHWDMEMMGWKYNMDDIHAALLLGQLAKVPSFHKQRENLEHLYRELLSDIEGLDFIEPPEPGEVSGHHLFTVLVPEDFSRDEVLTRLQEEGIGCAVNYRAVHNLSFFKETFGFRPEDFPVADRIGRRTITLPLYPKLTEEKVRFVCSTLKKILAR
ncbi:MAG: UDP-4-amino-4,6-dideoxy-N-acetyl-beta-L-altrosamine transaminase [Candidatus Riflebacteria bacterium HGW-Riflebacteria-2]|jgi:dTDP-4-amino-4,6-dideoxygalactose transaminase|nr:MAG: UDP-4-amino-4,6-dideoxy-N-acetyl-beta-L-altrosamine transaminase [Candidatus Riflebacteria bacterium HGW-Riflebacteria-2]